MPQGMQSDYKKESQETVAIKYPKTKKPTLLRSSYNPMTWNFMVMRAMQHPEIGAEFVSIDSEEGQAILQGTDPSDLTPEFLLGMDDLALRELADRYAITLTTKNTKKAIALKIRAAIEDGVKPKPVAAVSSGV